MAVIKNNTGADHGIDDPELGESNLPMTIVPSLTCYHFRTHGPAHIKNNSDNSF